MLNPMVVFIFSILGWTRSFMANLIQKIKKCQFKLKFGTRTISNMLFTFSILNWENPFLGKFGMKTTNMDTKKTGLISNNENND